MTKIHDSTINNKRAKINIGGMGIRGKKGTRKSLRCLGTDFEMIEGEGILSEEQKPDLEKEKLKLGTYRKRKKGKEKEKKEK